MKIKTTKELTFPELVVLYSNGELPYGEYIHENSDNKYSVSFDGLSIKVYEVTKGVDHNIKLYPTIPNNIKFKVTTEKEITEDTVLDTVVCLGRYKDVTLTKTRTGVSINDCIDVYLDADNEDILSISIVQDNELVTIWKDGEML